MRLPFTPLGASAFTALMLCLVATMGHAQSSLPSGAPNIDAQLRRDEERVRTLRNNAEKTFEASTPSTPLPAERLPLHESPCFVIQHLELQIIAAQTIPSASDSPESRLLQLVQGALSGPQHGDPPRGRCLGQAGISILLQRGQAALLQAGFVTSRVLAPGQDLTSANLTLSILPGYVKDIVLVDAAASPPAPDSGTGEQGKPHRSIRTFNTVPIQPGDLLNLRDIEQGLENLKRAPGADADIQIEPASDTGQSNLHIVFTPPSPARLNLGLDDSGGSNTGKYQGSATLSLDNLLGLSDLFYVTLTHSLPDKTVSGDDVQAYGTRGNIVSWSVPWGYWTFSTSGSTSHYLQSIPGPSVTNVYSGSSDNADIAATYLFHRDEVRKLKLSLKAWQRQSRNFVNDAEMMGERRAVGGWEIGYGHQEVRGDSTWDVGLHYKRGTSDFAFLPAPEESRNEGFSKFGLITLDASLTQAVKFKAWDRGFTWSSALHVQDNTTPLTPQDRMAIGGRNSVRGFDGTVSLVGERGWTLRNELSTAFFGSALHLYLGVDTGEVSGPTSDQLLGTTLTGAVLGVRGTYQKLQYEIFAGTPLGKPKGFTSEETTAGFNLNLGF